MGDEVGVQSIAAPVGGDLRIEHLAETPEGDILVAGSVGHGGGTTSHGFVGRFDSELQQQWLDVDSAAEDPLHYEAITRADNGTIVVVGSVGSGGRVRKCSADGQRLWTTDHTTIESFDAVMAAEDGEVVVAGHFNAVGGGDNLCVGRLYRLASTCLIPSGRPAPVPRAPTASPRRSASNQKKTPAAPGAPPEHGFCSGRSDVLGAGALGTLADVVLDRLAFAERLERDALEAGHVEEEVLTAAGGDESEPTIGESFDLSLWHRSYRLRSSASLTRILRPSRVAPSISRCAVWAWVASPRVTKPKPRERPVSRSRTTFASVTVPKRENA
mgnify:CR=1 FL=1